MTSIANVAELLPFSRRLRRPQHRWQVRTRPYQIQPICIAPVLPGETLKNLLFQARVVTDPIKNPLIGWWVEYYWFYVKHRDLEEREQMVTLVLDATASTAALNEAASTVYYHAGGSPNFAKLCLKRVVEEYFRAEEEAWDAYTLGGLPLANINQESWLDSVTDAASVAAVDVDVDGADANTTVQASEVEIAMRQYQLLRLQGLTQQSYEDWLRTYGVRTQTPEQHKPELIRYVRDWQYPSNTVDPATGTPSSAVSWVIQERADKDRYFSEPGWVIGVTLCRPKVYLKNKAGSLADFMDDAYRWLPAVVSDPRIAERTFTALTGPLPATNVDYVVDLRDLLIYGDQFCNFALTETDAGIVALPTATLQKRFPAEADINALFVDGAVKRLVRQDGVASFAIATRQRDESPSV